jgi:hypothetical protein
MADQDNRGNSLGEIAKAALTIGAGAAILYRGGGSRLLSNGVTKTTRFLSTVRDDVSGLALRDFDAARIRNLYNTHISGQDSTWSTIGRDLTDNVSIKQRPDNPKSLLNSFTEAFQTVRNPAFLESRIKYENISNVLQNDFRANFAQGDDELGNQIRQFVNYSVNNFSKAAPFTDKSGGYLFDNDVVNRFLDTAKLSSESIDYMKKAIIDARTNMPSLNNNFSNFTQELSERLQNTAELTKRFGSRTAPTKFQKFMDRVLGDRAATIDELITNADKLDNSTILSINKGFEEDNVDFGTQDVIELLKNRKAMLTRRSAEEAEQFGNLFVDNAVRIKDGKVYSMADAANAVHKLADSFANTLPGKIAKVRDILYIRNPNNWSYFGSGKADPILASYEKTGKTITRDRYVRIFNKMYKLNDNFQMEYIPELDNTYTTSGKHGTIPRTIKYLSGDLDRGKGTGIKLLDDLDILTSSRKPEWHEMGSILSKFKNPDWGRNLIRSFLNLDKNELSDNLALYDAGNPAGEEYIKNYYKKIKKLNDIMSEVIKTPGRSTVKSLYDTATGGAKDVLEMYFMNDGDLIERLGSLNNRPGVTVYHNYDLINMARSLASNTRSAKQMIKITSDKAPVAPSTMTLRHREMLQREILKEAFLQSAHGNSMRLNNINQWIERAKVTGVARENVKDIANWAVLQSVSSVFSKARSQGIEILRSDISRVQSLFSSKPIDGYSVDEGFASEFRKDMSRVAKQKFYTFQKGFETANDVSNQDIVQGNNFGEEMLMRKMVSPLDVLKNLNDTTKLKAFGKQFFAGRNNMQDVTTATLFPYFSLLRLVEPLETIGLGFSAKSTGSVGELAKNMALKRILPIAGLMTTYSYLDYRSQTYTGTSITGALANNLANMDLGFRKIQDAIGIGAIRDQGRSINPMAQYLFGKDYQTYDERKEWYESGYSPVRKGRWWSFGSSSEFRGGKIAYFQPNYLVRAHSDWHNIGVYGSSDEKWTHSLIPTPSHPFSTLRFLADPYWLEKKHYWDRPYPVSGKLFDENTPWGVVLNPTLGELIKPVRKMHEDELQGTLVDVRTLLSKINNGIFSRANDNSQGLIRLKGGIGGTAEAVSFTPALAPDPSERILNVHVSGRGDVSATYLNSGGASAYPTLSLSEYGPVHDLIQANAMGAAEGMPGTGVPGSQLGSARQAKLSFEDEIAIQAKAGSFFANIVRNYIPKHSVTDYISSVNAATKARAQMKPPTGIITPASIYNTQARYGSDLLMNSESLADIRNVTTTQEFLEGWSYSSRELGGIYGFLIDEAVAPRKRSKLQNAGRMASFSRQFWDASIGGFGGEFMEIARRFFPHEDHSINQLNPLKNTMPGWMPARFRQGDPYQMLPKGEMRLPGAAYESIYKLHPDMYGRYGAFDRFKILGDIAPWSSEYKIWRSLASQTTQDPALKKQIKEIRKRVQEQSKAHEFYPYRFRNLDTNSRYAVVDKILTDNKFSVVGDDNVYRLAGISVKRGKADPGLDSFLKSGMQVKIRYDKDKTTGTNPDKSINAVVYTSLGNLNHEMLKQGAATERDDGSAAGTFARFSQEQIDRGRVYETLAHLPIPYIHDKFMRVNSPLESYQQEQIYGVPFSSWSHPLASMLYPAFQKGFAYGPMMQTVGLGASALAYKINHMAGVNNATRLAVNALWAATDRGAFVGGLTGFITTLSGRSIRAGMYVGTAIQLGGYLATRSDKPINSILNFAAIGGLLAKQLNLPKIGINIGVGKGTLIGAAAGLAISALRNPGFDKEKMFGVYIPERVQKKREMEEYFDRLKYIKYMGLYEKAARKAKHHEGVDIKRILNKFEQDSEERQKIKKQLLESQQIVSNSYPEGDKERERLLQKINERLNALQYPAQILKAGKYTRAALAYKQAAESTIYGLPESASFAQLMRAVDKNDRDYILEFAKERNPKRQKEILKYISPYERRVLQTAWGQKPDQVESNESYFANHKLPGLFWAGWRPDMNLDNVEIKTIENEGMLLSDFGFYESQAQTPEAEDAQPIVNYDHGTGPIELRKNLLTALNGAGLIGVNVDIQPSSESGIQMVTNIVRVGDYKIKQGLNATLGRIFY